MDRVLVIILSILLALLNFFGNTSETQGDLPTAAPGSNNAVVQNTPTPKPTPTQSDKSTVTFDAIVKTIGDNAVDALADYNGSYYVSGDTVWIVCTYPSTRSRVIDLLVHDANALETYKTLRDMSLFLNASAVDILKENGHDNKNIVFEMGLSDGSQMFLIYNKDLMFDISTYDE